MSDIDPGLPQPAPEKYYPELLQPYDDIYESLTSPNQQRKVEKGMNIPKTRTTHTTRLSTDEARQVTQDETADGIAIRIYDIARPLPTDESFIVIEVLHGRPGQARFVDSYRLNKSNAYGDDKPSKVTYRKDIGEPASVSEPLEIIDYTDADMEQFEDEFTSRNNELTLDDFALLSRLNQLLAE